MTPTNKIILSFPKCGTKLLSQLYEGQGYHNFKSFFDTFRYSIANESPPYAVKMPQEQQLQIRHTRFQRGNQVDDWTHALMTKQRIKKFNSIDNTIPSIVTVYLPTFDYLAEAVDLFDDREVLCLRREDKFTQLVSRCAEIFSVTALDKNSITIDKQYFEFAFYSLLRLERLQNYCIDSGKGRLIDFNTLLQNKVDLGFEYNIKKEKFSGYTIGNIEQLELLFNRLCNKFNVRWGNEE